MKCFLIFWFEGGECVLDILNGRVRVYNYERSPIGFPSQSSGQGVFIESREDDEDFVVERVAWEDIEIENSKSDIFKIGRLRFDPKEEDEIYEKLGIHDKENIMNDSEIVKLLQDASVENLKRINKLDSNILLSRLKGMLFEMERKGKEAPRTVITVVLERCEEKKSGSRREEGTKFIDGILNKEKEDKENSELKKNLQKMQERIEAMESNKEEPKEDKKEDKDKMAEVLEKMKQLEEENAKLKQKQSSEKNKVAEKPKTAKKNTKKEDK